MTSNELAVLANSLAAKADLKEDDVVLEVDGKAINDNYTLAEAVKPKSVGGRVILKVIRNDLKLTAEGILEETSL